MSIQLIRLAEADVGNCTRYSSPSLSLKSGLHLICSHRSQQVDWPFTVVVDNLSNNKIKFFLLSEMIEPIGHLCYDCWAKCNIEQLKPI